MRSYAGFEQSVFLFFVYNGPSYHNIYELLHIDLVL